MSKQLNLAPSDKNRLYSSCKELSMSWRMELPHPVYIFDDHLIPSSRKECLPSQLQLENQSFRKELSVFPANSQSEAFSFLIEIILSLFLCHEKRGQFNKFNVHFVLYSLDRFLPINLDSEKTKKEIIFFLKFHQVGRN